MKKIRKRDGSVVFFQSDKIEGAIWKAVRAVGGKDRERAKEISGLVVEKLERISGEHGIADVEDVQDLIEKVLIEEGHAKVGKAFILYRKSREELRDVKGLFDTIEAVEDYIGLNDWMVKENSNMGYSLQGLNNYIATKIVSNYWMRRIYPEAVRKVHEAGDLHVHDLGCLGAYCVGWDLKDLLTVGFKGVKGKVESKPAKHLRTALGQMVNFFYTLQGESAGAQAFSNFDTLLAPFIRYDNLSYRQVKQAMQEFVFNMAVPTRVGFQCMSDDTEILTPSGWVGYEGVRKGDLIKTFNVESGEVEDKVVRKMFSRRYKGVMYSLKNRIQDQLISPGHRIVRKKFGGDSYCLDEVENVLGMKSPFIVPVAGKNVRGDVNISDDEIGLVAWIISEGTIEHSGQKHRHCKRVTIYQSKIKKPNEYGEIVSLLDKFGLDYSVRDSSPALGDSVKMIRLNASSSRKIHKMFGMDDRVDFVPAKFLNMSERQARLFLDVYIKGDGFEGCKISTTSVEILDGLQQVVVSAGYGFSVLTREPTIGTKMIYVLRLIKHRDTYIQKVESVDYEGVIWCPNTDNETVIARRNGKVFITGNTPFTNITMDLEVPSYMKDEYVIVGGHPQMDKYGDFQEEMNVINKAFAECMLEGDASGQVFTFPIPTYNITKDFDFDKPEHELIWEMTAKYGIPYFSNFVNSDMKPEDARSMCCRLRIDNTELRKRGGGLFGANPLTGSIGVVTINMARLGYVSTNEDDFTMRLDRLMELAKESLETKRKTIERFTEMGLYPYSKFYLRQVHERFGEYWKNHFGTIGLLGMNEAVKNFMPGEDITTEKGREFGLKILDFMRERLTGYQEETGSIYNLEATPGEGTTYRFARMDKKRFGRIIVANEESFQKGAKPYYTNSSQLPVDFTDDVFEALDLQDEMQCKYTGGTVFHTFVGERMTTDAVKKMVKKISNNYRLPYFTITPTFSICPIHGYLSGDYEWCPKCDLEVAEGRGDVVEDVVAEEEAKKRLLDVKSEKN